MTIIKKTTTFIFLATIAIIFVGCESTRTRMVVDGMGTFLENMKIAINKADDIELVRESMPTGLLQLEGFLEISPHNDDLLVRTSEGYYSYAFVFIEDNDKDRAIKFYRKSKKYALRALKRHKSFSIDPAITEEKFKKILKKIKKYEVPALFFLCSSWMKLLELNPQANTLSIELSQIETILDRILILDENFQYGGPHVLLAGLYSTLPQNMGGNPEQAKFHFDEAIDISDGKYLLWQLMLARYYAVQVKDKQLFTSTLNDIISAPDNLLPQANFSNLVAKQKAQALLDNIKSYF